MSPGFNRDPHSEGGNACPKNRFGITDDTELQRFESPLAAKRIGELADSGVTGSFNVAPLHSTHRFIVQDIFPWAGEIKAIHPLREDNGRTQREFIRQLAVQAGHPLSWAGFTQQQRIDASILSHMQAENSELAAILPASLYSTRGDV